MSEARERARELFALLDKQNRGFILRDELEQLPIPSLDPDALQLVFDRLDLDRDGRLTLPEFVAGFGERVWLHFWLQLVNEYGDN